MTASECRATSPEEAFWTLDPRALVLLGEPWIVDIERRVPLGLGASMRQPDLAPMLEVRGPGDGHDVVRPEAAAAIEQMLDARVVLPTVFDDPAACVHALARWSGGHMRHLLQIARRAVEEAAPERITARHIERAGRSLGVRLIARLRPEDIPRAVEVHRSHRIVDTDQDCRMLANACVLTYGGDASPWWDVHPAIWADPLFQVYEGGMG